MLFMHEVHKVRGRDEDDFEAAFREGWMSTLDNYAVLVHLLTNDIPPEHRGPGT